ncbi:MAG: hypothetical protein RSH26_07940, partial [Clostridia bacterium]
VDGREWTDQEQGVAELAAQERAQGIALDQPSLQRVLLVRTGGLDRSLLREYPPIWQRAAQEAPVADLSAMLGAVFEARKRKASQVNWQSNIDHLLMKLLEEQTKWHQLLA